MQSPEARQRADQFFALHSGDRPLVLVHAWDAGSARVVEQAGAAAVATTSAGMSWSLGYAEGERVPIAEVVGACERICRAVTVPVCVEIPASATDDEACAVVRQLIATGVVGVTIGEHLASLPGRTAAVRSLARDLQARLFINAQIHDTRYDVVLDGARKCVAAGADGVSIPALGGYDAARLTRVIPVPVEVDVGDGWGPPIYGLARAGVRRISLEHGPFKATLGLLRHIAEEAVAGRHLHGLMTTHYAS